MKGNTCHYIQIVTPVHIYLSPREESLANYI